MPTTSRSSKSVPPFTIQLQQENTMENKWHKVEITKVEIIKEAVSSIEAVKMRLSYVYISYTSTSMLKIFIYSYIEQSEFKHCMVHLAAPTHAITSDYAQTVFQILGLVSFAQNTMGEGPIIVVSK